MNSKNLIRAAVGACLLVLLASLNTPAQDTVTISKERLRELEAKEAELKRLKEGPAPVVAAPATSATASPVVAPPKPPTRPMKELPSLQPGDVVEAAELAAHYRADTLAADQRYQKQSIAVRGEVLGFERVMMTRQTKILLKTGETDTRVVCELSAPSTYDALYTVKAGSELVGSSHGSEVTLAKLGGTVVMHGQCKGMRNGVITIAKCQLP